MKRIAGASFVLFAVVLCTATTASVAGAQPLRSLARGPSAHVSGRWTVVVRNRAGRIVRRAAFENSLVGTNVLPQLLAGSATAGTWQIEAVEVASSGSSQGPGKKTASILKAPATAGSWSAIPSEVALSATIAIPSAGVLSAVSSTIGLCPSSVAPAACGSSAATVTTFTKKDGLSFAVTKGDTASFSVVLSVQFQNNGVSQLAQSVVQQVLLGTAVPGVWDVDSYGLSYDFLSSGGLAVQAVGGALVFTGSAIINLPSVTGGSYVVGLSFCNATTAVTVSPETCAASTAARTSGAQFLGLSGSGSAQVTPGQEVVVTIRLVFS